MQFIVKARIPLETGNQLMQDPSFGQKMDSVMQDLKPSAVYFTLENGQRTILMVVNIQSSHDLPAFAEPLWLAFKADVEFLIAMGQDDFAKAQPHIAKAVKKYG
jgi:hypothetical protein